MEGLAGSVDRLVRVLSPAIGEKSNIVDARDRLFRTGHGSVSTMERSADAKVSTFSPANVRFRSELQCTWITAIVHLRPHSGPMCNRDHTPFDKAER